MLSVVITAVIGLITGAAGRALMPAADPGGLPTSLVVGICGAMLAHFISVMSGLIESTALLGHATSVAGALAGLVIYRFFLRLETGL
jgi:uncharacterized membrane protein YeaQ/YmgE (transglycosylase-associated protein family)